MEIKLNGSVLNVDGRNYPCINFNGDFCVTVNQLAEIADYNPKSIRAKIKNNSIQVIKLKNKRVLIKVSEVQRLLKNGLLIKYACA